MRVSEAAKMENFDINKILGTEKSKTKSAGINPSRDEVDALLQVDRFTPSNVSFNFPNWNNMISKTDPIMSDEEFEKAIWEMAWQDAANGLSRMSNPQVAELRRAFVSVVSPDRKAAFAQTMSQTGGKMPINQIILDNNGNRLMHYSPNGFWLPRNTNEERSRLADFNRMYQEAYAAYEKEHGKVEQPQKGPVTVNRMPSNPFV
jgi:hypothetical protein